MPVRFQWDPRKAAANLKKHGISFDEAVTVFADSLSLTVPDPAHSLGEARFALLGASHRQRLVVVAHAEIGATIRIISARLATRAEKRAYEQG